MRERAGGADHDKEFAYRNENYTEFKNNVREAFNKYNTDGNNYLDRQEFKNFMTDSARLTGLKISDEMLEQLFIDMDVNHDGEIEVEEFIDAQFKAFKNCEDNIEFLANDIKGMD